MFVFEAFMIAKGTKFWNFEALLGANEGEITLSSDEISLYPLFRDDYLYTQDEIRREQNMLSQVGMTKRIVVERTADGYSLIGPLLPYLALSASGSTAIPCIVRSGDLPQVQQVLGIRLNAQYSRLSPLVYARLIARLERLFPVMKAVSGMNLGIKRDWIAGILGISPSAVLRYAYISKVPEALQLRCSNPDFPYLCYKETRNFTDSQFRQLLEELIHYELHSRYIQISAGELSEIIARIAAGKSTSQSNPISTDRDTFANAVKSTLSSHKNSSHAALYDPAAEAYYQNLTETYEDRFDAESEAGTDSEMMRIAHRDGYYVPDEALREASYLLYSLSRMRLAGGQRLLDYACLRSILDSVDTLYDHIVL